MDFFRTLGLLIDSPFHTLTSHQTLKFIPFHNRSYGQFCDFSTQTIPDTNFRHFTNFKAFCLPLPPKQCWWVIFDFNALAIAPAYLIHIPTTLYEGRRGLSGVDYDFLDCYKKIALIWQMAIILCPWLSEWDVVKKHNLILRTTILSLGDKKTLESITR